MSNDNLPSVVEEFAQAQPAVWEAYNQLGKAAGEAGPLDAKSQCLVKLSIAIGSGRQGAVRAHARRGRHAGLTLAEMEHVAILATTTAGWPAAFAARCWIHEAITKEKSFEADADE